MDTLSITPGFEDIINIIARHPDGVLLVDIVDSLKKPLLKRTIQRRLYALKASGLIQSSGKGRATRYYISSTTRRVANLTTDGYISLSSEGEEVRQQIAKPLHERIDVFYNRDFLDAYIPNQSFYLKPEIRAHLKEIGEQPDGQQPAGTFAFKILDRLLIDLSWNSSRLEGNTYSLLETEHLIHDGEIAQGKDLFETRMILNHKAAIEFLVELREELGFNQYIILNLHALLAKNLLKDPSAPGRLRSIPVSIGKTAYQPLAIPQVVDECFKKIILTANAIHDPFEQSFFSMVHLPYLQPFVDVNKRVSRLAANIPLIKNNLCPISFVDLPKKAYIDGILGVYELNNVNLLADVYLWAYEHSTKRYSEAQAYLTEPDVFLEKYDNDIYQLVREIILERKSKGESSKIIERWAHQHLPKNDQAQFIETVETELLALHYGNIAKYKIKPDEMNAWQTVWKKA